MKNIFILSALFIACAFSSVESGQVGTYKMYFNGTKAYLVNTEIGVVYEQDRWSSNDDNFHSGFGINKIIYSTGWANFPAEQGCSVVPYLKDE